MANSVWKGHLTFGLVSIPVKLYRAARPEKLSFRQIHEPTGARVRQALFREEDSLSSSQDGPWKKLQSQTADHASSSSPIPFPSNTTAGEVNRSDLAKGYEYEKDRYLVLTRDEIESITPRTAYEMQILEFVKLSEVDPIYFETSYYVAPDKAGAKAYALLLAALRASSFVAIAQVAMHRREHVVVIRPGRTGIVLHTMFYESEIRREEEHRPDLSQVAQKELDLAVMLINSLANPFDSSKYRDSYRDKLEALIANKLAGKLAAEKERARPAPVVNILDALQRSLQCRERKLRADAPGPDLNGKQVRRRQRQPSPQQTL